MILSSVKVERSWESWLTRESKTSWLRGHGVMLNTCWGLTRSHTNITRLKSDAERA